MELLNVTYPTPEENLACDEALLNAVEADEAGECLRFWESETRFIVLGVAQTVRDHVDVRQCAADNVPILRRCSAGGCVIQGPGSLNYTLALRYANRPETQTIRGSYCYILNRIAAEFQGIGLEVRHRGISDLAWNDRKISGNAQRRRKYAFLHHGTLLYGPHNDWMQRYLLEPADRPDYRGSRTHEAFIARLPFDGGPLRALIRKAFELETSAENSIGTWVHAEMARLLDAKYRDPGWHRRR